MSWGWSTDKNTSAGGHTYDRTTGSWVGETQGSVGDGSNWGAPSGAPTRVIHDANGPVAREIAPRGSGVVTDEGRLVGVDTAGPAAAGVAKAGTATTGPGAAGAVTGVGTVGAGAAGIVAMPLGGPRRTAGRTLAQLTQDDPSKLMPIYVGGRRMAMDLGWSNAGDVEERLGEGEFLSPSWFYGWSVSAADGYANLDVRNDGPLKTQKINEDVYNAPGVVGGVLRGIAEGYVSHMQGQRDPFGPDKRPASGSLFKTGGF